MYWHKRDYQEEVWWTAMGVLVEDPPWCQRHWKYSQFTLLLSNIITFWPFSVNFQIQTQIWVFTCAFQDRACYSKQEGTRRRQHQAMEPSCSQTWGKGILLVIDILMMSMPRLLKMLVTMIMEEPVEGEENWRSRNSKSNHGVGWGHPIF